VLNIAVVAIFHKKMPADHLETAAETESGKNPAEITA